MPLRQWRKAYLNRYSDVAAEPPGPPNTMKWKLLRLALRLPTWGGVEALLLALGMLLLGVLLGHWVW